MVDIEGIKAANKIEDVVEETHPLQKNSGRYLRCLEHDSLVVDTQSQYFVWNSQGKSGDVIEWLEITRGWDFKQAVEWLADRAGMTLHMDAREAAAVKAHRAKVDVLTKLVEFLRGKLVAAPAAAEYCERRGWTAETVERAGMECSGGGGRGVGRTAARGSHATAARLNEPDQMLQMLVVNVPRAELLQGAGEVAPLPEQLDVGLLDLRDVVRPEAAAP